MSQRYGQTIFTGQAFGFGGLGVLGSTLRAETGPGQSGAVGPGLLYDSWRTGDDAKEFRAFFESPPSGVLLLNQNGSGTYTGASSVGTWRLFVDGADLGTTTATFTNAAVVLVTGAGNIPSAEAFGVPTITATFPPGTVQITDAGNIASAEVFGIPTVTPTFPPSVAQVTEAGGIPSAEAFGIPTVTAHGSDDVPDPLCQARVLVVQVDRAYLYPNFRPQVNWSKDPDEELDYGFDFSLVLAQNDGDSIIGWTVETTGIDLRSSALRGSVVGCLVYGGDEGTEGVLTARVSTIKGRVIEASLHMIIAAT